MELLKEVPMQIAVSKNTLLKILVVAVILLIISNFILIGRIAENKPQPSNAKNNFDLIFPTLAKMEVNEFKQMQKYYHTNYAPLKEKIIKMLSQKKHGNYSFYFEDLNTGAWIGINEKDKYVPGSLLKIPVVTAILKKIDNGELSLDTPLTILEEDVDPIYGVLAERGFGYNLNVDELINYSFYYSDNTANAILRRNAGDDYLTDAILGLGIPYGTYQEFVENEYKISPKDYSNILRSLYFSSYLRRYYSQFILSHLVYTNFSDALPAGIPKNIRVAHKIGDKSSLYHDCGIVYVPNKPYIICLMVKDTSSKEAKETIKDISKITYEYVTSN